MRKPKERIIYDNYNGYDFDDIKSEMDGEPNDQEVWDEIYELQQLDWDDEKSRLDEVFNDWKGRFIAVGTCGLWHGNYKGGFLFKDFDDLARQLFKDCEYFKFWDENGHLYVECSHHDGTHSVEIKQLTDKGEEYYDNWDYNWNDKRKDSYVYEKLFTDSHYSHLIHFANRMYGVPKIEFVSD